jgi:hypothetical protein
VYFGDSLIFQKNVLLPSSGQEGSKLSLEQANQAQFAAWFIL